jgi:hypothetical protein
MDGKGNEQKRKRGTYNRIQYRWIEWRVWHFSSNPKKLVKYAKMLRDD